MLIGFITWSAYTFIPASLDIVNEDEVNITIEGSEQEIKINNKQEQELIKILKNIKIYRGAPYIPFEHGKSGNFVIALKGNYNFIHIYILEEKPSYSFVQRTDTTKWKIKKEDAEKILYFLHKEKIE
ncbi:hypothetical protein [Anaerovorax odorimutans]|uniref:hypothetical protein n=1 Tax=Anaerovorax odorimutans TaxID=109327 RepID=UPI00042687B3|nr:hypothetical protein [Anaerovorax odorimutans]